VAPWATPWPRSPRPRHAEAFRDTHGGRILTFEEIDLELLTELGRLDASMQPSPHHGETGAGDHMHGH
jgi:copper chaperone NosL